ncbi:hypothetical protein CVT26_004206 [Gymnopilus dilepis]|uniref:Uncharacterized protein n=1 Tax=Gymnopilus dilepis TaxID=231916 RepID=A0A409YMW2_9AGAR|nr:hypothetical protein CVT26_004206 [Gymnopilus dilepis]
MPPKGGFLVPGTPASKKQLVKGDYSGKHGRRMIANEFQAMYGDDREQLERDLAALTMRHLRPLAHSTLIKYTRVERIMLAFFTWYLKGESNALTVFKADAPCPQPALLKLIVGNVAKNAKSGLGMGFSSWTHRTTLDFVKTMFSVLRRHGVTLPSRSQKDDVLNYVTHLAKVDRVLPTAKRAKRLVRHTDLVDFLAAALSNRVHFGSGYMAGAPSIVTSYRIQVTAFAQILFMHGLRPGCIVRVPAAVGKEEYLQWKDLEFIITGWEDGVGVVIQCFCTLRFMKNMRDDDGQFLRVSSRTLSKENIICDPLLTLLAMAIRNNIFQDNLLKLFDSKEAVQGLRFPHILKMHDGVEGLPVFTQATDTSTAPDIDGLAPPPSSAPKVSRAKTAVQERAARVKYKEPSDVRGTVWTAPLTQSAINYHCAKVAKSLSWKGFMMKSFRYSFAGDMLTKIPEAHLKYLMGHRITTNLVTTEYQVPDRDVDVSAVRFGGVEDRAIIELHSSVAWDIGEKTLPDITLEDLKKDLRMKKLVDILAKAEQRVHDKFGCGSKEVSDEFAEHELVEAAGNAWGPSRSTSRMSTTSDTPSRQRSNSVSSDVSMISAATPMQEGSALDKGSETALDHDLATSLDENLEIAPEVEELISHQLGNLTTSHPFQDVLAAEKENPRYLYLCQLLSMIKSDDLQEHGICPTCFSDEELSPQEKVRCHTDKFSYHYWKCQDEHTPDHWRCPICADMIPCLPKDREGPLKPHEEVIQADLEAHRNHCYHELGVCLRLIKDDDIVIGVEEVVEDEEEPDEEEPTKKKKGKSKSIILVATKGAFGYGYRRLSVSTRLVNCVRGIRRYFCPICFFLPEGSLKTKAQRDGDDDPRFTVFLSGKELAQHLITHWASQKRKAVGGIEYERTFECKFPECKEFDSMKTGEMITHLHNVHDYVLVECSLQHEHSPECYELPETGFMTTTDAKLMADHLGEQMPTTNLREWRRTKLQETQARKILALPTTKKQEELEEVAETAVEEELVVETPVDEHAVEDVQAEETPEPVLRRFLAAFADSRPTVAGTIEKVGNYLIEQGIDVEMCEGLQVADLAGAGVQWLLKDVMALRVFVRSWTG